MSKSKKVTNTVETIESELSKKYQKLTQQEHVLTRPGMYVGSVQPTYEPFDIFNEETGQIEKQKITYTPAFFKTIDELIVNARDHQVREETCKTIKISFSQEKGWIKIFNDGPGIPVTIHNEHKIYVPELIFGHLLTSSNYDDEEKRVVGGLNGLGAKLCNIYSTKFIVETVDIEISKKKFVQEFRNNMLEKDEPTITKAKSGDTSYTQITYYPDFKKFSMVGLSDSDISWIHKRAYDIAACTRDNVKIYVNDELIKIKNFKDYINIYYPEPPQLVYREIGKRWKIGIIYAPDDGNHHVSFVNAIDTYKGGTHVNYILDQIVDKTIEQIKKKITFPIKPMVVKQHLDLFVDATIENPDFPSQTKSELTTKVSQFGSKCEIPDEMMKELFKTDLIDTIISIVTSRAADCLNKTDGKKQSNINVPKLDDAKLAGSSKDSLNCRLILTEGDSAKAFAVDGLTVIGKDRYGVFPLRGKLLNVRNATLDQIKKNEEIAKLKQIMGLQQGVKYNTPAALKKLRYGGILCLTDSDSVTGDTSLLLKGTDHQYCVKTIDDISKDWILLPNGKEVSLTDYKIWTENGWTKIKQVIRHKVQKKIYRVLTHTGVVDVTEDHSLLKDDKTVISPKDCVVGQSLLHSFPQFEEHKHDIPDDLDKKTCRELWKYAKLCKIQYYQLLKKDELIDALNEYKNKIAIDLDTDDTISEDEAYAMGLFFADGTCGTYEWKYKYKPKNRSNEYTFNRVSYSWAITNTNMDYLNKAIAIMKNNYDYEFKIIEDRHSKNNGHQMLYKLIINGGKLTKPFVDKYRSMFYDKDAKKKVPPEILNASYQVRKNFFEGYYDGDGYKASHCGAQHFDIDGKIGAHGLFFLCKSLGYEVSINTRESKPKIYILIITKGTQQANPIKIKKIIDLGTTEQYVYDLETANHHFQAGVGQMIVHNTDGIHIRGLIINVFQYFWPELLKIDGFIQTLSTPLIKVFKKTDKAEKDPIKFYSENDYNKWAKENDSDKYNVNYYKGLGTSTKKERIEAFQNYDEKVVSFVWENCDEETSSRKSKRSNDDDSDGEEDVEEDGEEDDEDDNETINSTNLAVKKKKRTKKGKISLVVTDPDIINSKSYNAITLGFDMDRADERKEWLRKYDKNDTLEYTRTKIPYSEFINRDLIHFSNDDIMRSIPSVMDGLKPSQRKVLYICLKDNIKNPLKVNQLASKVSEKTAYKHGEVSLEGTIIGMAQDYPGANNINLLNPKGGFGDRSEGGKNSSSTRYIKTCLESITEKIFSKHDNCILVHLEEEGDTVEPEFYYPIFPMVLVNGCSGIGTGFSTNIPQYNPMDICENLMRRINGESMIDMVPWYQGFTGSIVKESSNTYKVFGKYDIQNSNLVNITEIPIVGFYSATNCYEEKVLKPLNGLYQVKETKSKEKEKETKKPPVIISSYFKHPGSDVINFEIEFVGNELQNLVKKGGTEFEDTFKLISKISTKNMHLYDAKGHIKKYDNVLDIIEDFYKARLKAYVKRKEYYIRVLENEINMLKYKVKFIKDYLNRTIKLEREKREKVIEQLVTLKYPKLNYSIEAPVEKRTYDYITGMQLFSLTLEKIEELENEYKKKQDEYDDYNSITIEELWKRELNDFMISYNKWLDEKAEREKVNEDNSSTSKKKKTQSKTKSNAKK
jgi:DNA gyrase/topoisomerase IV subunit B